MVAQQLIQRYQLEPLYPEGGFFRRVISEAGYSHILYLLTRESPSALHRLDCDEIWQFCQGDIVEHVMINTHGEAQLHRLGVGQRLAVHVPSSFWQGARIVGEGSFALVGCTVIPPFSDSSYEHGHYGDLITQYPHLEELLSGFCRPEASPLE